MKYTFLMFSAFFMMSCAGVKVTQNQHEYVDLGLPSGTLWATCNVGANNPEEKPSAKPYTLSPSLFQKTPLQTHLECCIVLCV